MPAKTFTAPRVWKRPYTSVYSDNYRYGNSLYSGAVSDIENRGRGYGYTASSYGTPSGGTSSGGASVISDPGVRRAILEAELLTSSDIMAPSSMQSMLNSLEESQRQSAISGLNRSTSNNSSSRNYQLESSHTTITTTSRPEASSYSAYTSAKDLAHVESELEEARHRRRRERQGRSLNRPETMYTMSSYEYDPMITSNNDRNRRSTTPPPNSMVNPTAESHLKDWSLERWYEKAVRNAHRPAAFPIR